MRASSSAQRRALHWKVNMVYGTLIEQGLNVPEELQYLIDNGMQNFEALDILETRKILTLADVDIGKTIKSMQKLSFLLEELFGIIEYNANTQTPISAPMFTMIKDIMSTIPTISSQRILVDIKLRCIINTLMPKQLAHITKLFEDPGYLIPPWQISYTGFSVAIKAKRYNTYDKAKVLEYIEIQIDTLSNLNEQLQIDPTLTRFPKIDLVQMIKIASWVPNTHTEFKQLLKEADDLKTMLELKHGYRLY